MGQKVNPIGFRLGVNKTWESKWYVNSHKYADTLHEDLAIRKALLSAPEVQGAEIAKVELTRNPQRVTVYVHTSRPGIIIGTKGANIEALSQRLMKLSGKKVQIKIVEVAKPAANAQLVAQNIARQLAARGSYKRILKKAVSDAMRDGAQGIKIKLSGRLNGAEIARTDGIKEGRIPLHTLRSNIDYGFTPAHTSYGAIGVKVWIYNGEIFNHATNNKNDAGLVVKRVPEHDTDVE